MDLAGDKATIRYLATNLVLKIINSPDDELDSDIPKLYGLMRYDLVKDEEFRKEWNAVKADMSTDEVLPGTEDMTEREWHYHNRLRQFACLIAAARRAGVLDAKPLKSSGWVSG